MNTNLFYAEFYNGDKILFTANSIKSAKSFKTKYAKKNNTNYLIGGYAYTLPLNGINISEYKKVN